MAYDEALASRIRESLRDRRDVTERKMFGGLAFLVTGHMCCGIVVAISWCGLAARTTKARCRRSTRVR